MPQVLRTNRNFRNYFLGQSVSLLGDQITAIALPLTAIIALDATPGQMGALTTVYLLPNLLFSLHAGVWVDRSGRRRLVMLVADVARALLMLTIPIAFALHELTWPQLYAVSFLLGTANVFFYVSYGGFFQTIVAREDFIDANTLLNGSRGFSFLGGTSLGGALVQLLHGPYALALDAVTFLWSALFLGRVDAEDPPGAPRESGGLSTGLRWIRHNPVMRAELLGVATINFFNFIYWALFLLYASRYLDVSPVTIGVVIGVAAAGTDRAGDRSRARLPGRLLPLPRAPAARAAGAAGRAALARDRLPVHRRVRLGAGADAARHPRRRAAGRAGAAADPVARQRRVHGRQLRGASAGHDARGHPRHDHRRPQHDLGRRRRRAARDGLPPPLADPADQGRAGAGGDRTVVGRCH